MKKNIILMGTIMMLSPLWGLPQTITATDNTDIEIWPSANSQHEVHISINKTNPWNILVSTNTTLSVGSTFSQGYYYTQDNGATWTGSDNMPHGVIDVSGDPSNAFDASGRAYMSTLPFKGYGYLVNYSDDECSSWSDTIVGIDIPGTDLSATPRKFQDKDMISCVDEMQTSGYANNFYCVWTDYVNGSVIKINQSSDGCSTFSAPVTLSSAPGTGAVVQTGPNGEIYVCWADFTSGAPVQDLGFAVSTNGGASFSTSFPISLSGVDITSGGNPMYDNTRVNSFPTMAVDKSCGPNRGRVYIAYPELVDPGASPHSIIRVTYLDPGSSSWSTPVTVSGTTTTTPPSYQNWFPWIAVDDLTGLVNVVYYGNYLDNTNTWVAYSGDGAAWSYAKVSDVAHTTAPIDGGSYAGDYIGIASFNGSSWAAWMDNRTGTWKVYVSRIDYNLPIITSSQTNLQINQPPQLAVNGTFQAVQKIEVSNLSQVAVASTANIEMKAGEAITLNPGFSTVLGGVFTAMITSVSSCTTPGAISFKREDTSMSNAPGILKQDINGVHLFAYPIPVSDYVTIGLLNNNYKNVSMSIFDLRGNIVNKYSSPTITQEQIRQIINMQTYASGEYLAVVEVDGKNYTLKFSKI